MLGTHPTLHVFLQSIKKCIYESEVEFRTVTKETKISHEVKITSSLIQIQNKLKKKKITIEEFTNNLAINNLKIKIGVSLNWPQYRNDDCKLDSFPNPRLYFSKDENEEELENPCCYCFNEEASIQVRGCNHFIGCYACWFEASIRYKKKTCPKCRANYQKVNIY
ncbi:uncharacterized protein LOC130678093 [Microplitis mediator]|uniref:uncharacterized protein LOC130670563 n=1 Tax=Microplitis mediator TaxID=375433 RepID=UPI0025572FC0|nr:uncharacterized protein LOC130670563 [Microplitis mediator]XP_057330101.1 uncharacterized protein LOC130670693 [Microplitis mediator]XP_057341063.1 uncharacterized protein LOC130678091 [Microplitis mediator]XP_057341064.1 uncharacterized protein LOC130678092 [Microplitis mediator]XP_057341065.1 uncharacterized protein LOC130678093 [Microplitis mediator]